MVKGMEAPLPENGISNPLSIEYDRFVEDEIPDDQTRFLLNRICGKAQDIVAIARILRANSAERFGQVDTGTLLNERDETGLLEALVELSMGSYDEARSLGDSVVRMASEVQK